MTINEARKKALFEKAQSKSGSEIMSAFFYIANPADLKRMSEVLETELRASQFKNLA